jgi:hypothetical protein
LETRIEISSLQNGCYYLKLEGEEAASKPLRFYKL